MNRVYIDGNKINSDEILEEVKKNVKCDIKIENIRSFELNDSYEILLIIFELMKNISFSTAYDILKFTLLNIYKQIVKKELTSKIQFLKITNGSKVCTIETNMQLTDEQKNKLIDATIKDLLEITEITNRE